MTRNNVCNSLIVYGSWAPGGAHHHLVSTLPGEWKKGIMLVGTHSSGDDLQPGENIRMEAWIIKFSDCGAKMFTPEWEAEKRTLFDRWTALDLKMGPGLERGQRSWWPEDQVAIRGKNGQVVVNIYLPLKNFPHLKNLQDTPGPEEENDIKKLWSQQRSGEKKYEDYQFVSLIKDSTFPECQEMFGGLPDIDSFLSNLSDLYKDMAYEDGYLLKQTEDRFHLYAFPKPEQAIPSDQALEFVNKIIRQKCLVLETNKASNYAKQLSAVKFEIGPPPENKSTNSSMVDALEEANEMIADTTYGLKDQWKYCLSEACYGIASNYIVRDYLMSHFYKINYDFKTPYQLWKGSWNYQIHKTTCYIFMEP